MFGRSRNDDADPVTESASQLREARQDADPAAYERAYQRAADNHGEDAAAQAHTTLQQNGWNW
jgi:hypothetical protein